MKDELTITEALIGFGIIAILFIHWWTSYYLRAINVLTL